MIKFLKIFGFSKKNIIPVIKPYETKVFAKYNTVSKLLSKQEKPLTIVYDYKSQIPVQYTTPEFRSYMSQTALKRKNARETKLEQIKLELKKREAQARIEMFDMHEKAVSNLMYMDPRKLDKSRFEKEMKSLTNPDICLDLLDYDGYRVTNIKHEKFESNTNNILLRQIAKGDKSPKRAELLISRFMAQVNPGKYFDRNESIELTNAILRTGDEKQLQEFSKTLEKYASMPDILTVDLCGKVFNGITKAAKEIPLPKELAKPAEIAIKKNGEIMLKKDAVEALSYFEGKFDLIAELLKSDRDILHSPQCIASGFRSAVKDGRLEDFRELVFLPKNKRFFYLIENICINPSEEELFRKEITSKLLGDEYKPIFESYEKTRLDELFNNK